MPIERVPTSHAETGSPYGHTHTHTAINYLVRFANAIQDLRQAHIYAFNNVPVLLLCFLCCCVWLCLSLLNT